MTYLEKARELRPRTTENSIVKSCCPDGFGLEKMTECVGTEHIDCQKCWNREMPVEVTNEQI